MRALGRLARGVWARPFAVHAVVYLAVLVAVVLLGGADTTASSDEGAYLVQARALQRGSFSVPYPFAAADRTYSHYGFINAEVTSEGGYLFAGRPIYPWLVSQLVVAFGENVGPHVLPVLGALGAAMVGWAVAASIDPRLRRTAFWVVAIGPPLVNAGFIWAHAPSAALGGLAVLGLVGLVQGQPRWWSYAALAAGLVAGAIVRTEGVLFAASAAAVLGVALWRQRRSARLAFVIGVSAAAAAAFLGQRALASRIQTGSPIVRPSTGGSTGGRFSGIVNDVLVTSFFDRRANLLGLVALALLVVGVLLLAHGGARRRQDAKAALLAAAMTYVLRLIVVPDAVTIGLLLGWPVAVLAIFGTRWSELDATKRAVAMTALVFTAALAGVDYSNGGGFQWAGRYLSPITVPIALLAVVAVSQIDETRAIGSVQDRGLARAVLVGLAVVPTASGLYSMASVRDVNRQLLLDAHRVSAPVVITPIASLPRLDWQRYPEVTYLLTGSSGIRATLELASSAMPPSIGVVGGGEPPQLAGYALSKPDPSLGVWEYTRSAGR